MLRLRIASARQGTVLTRSLAVSTPKGGMTQRTRGRSVASGAGERTAGSKTRSKHNKMAERAQGAGAGPAVGVGAGGELAASQQNTHTKKNATSDGCCAN